MRNLLLTLTVVLVCGGVLPAAAQTADARYPVVSDSGRIEQLDFANSTMVVGGLRYGVVVDLKVEIGGSFGAFTMLRPGMRIRYDYLQISPTERRMVLIQELPANVDVEET